MLERLGLVDGCGIDDWEADRRSRLANHLLFWIWYLPLDLVGSKLGHTSSIDDQLRLAVRLGGHQALPLIDAAGGGGPAETAGLRNGTLQHVDAPSRRRIAHCSHHRHSPPVPRHCHRPVSEHATVSRPAAQRPGSGLRSACQDRSWRVLSHSG